MNRIKSFLLALLCLSFAALTGCTRVIPHVQESAPAIELPENPTFRNTVWGMDREIVEQIEKGEIYDEYDNMITLYNTVVADYSARPFYCFDGDNKLWRAGYTFDAAKYYSSKNLCISKYEAIVRALTEKYGEYEDKTWWGSDLYKDKPNKWDTALTIGDVEFVALWQTPDTEIWVKLYYDDGIYLILYYDALTYTKVEAPINTDGL